MSTVLSNQSESELFLNEVLQSLHTVIPEKPTISSPQIVTKPTFVELGVLVKFTGDINAGIVLNGNRQAFSSIGELLYGMMLDGEMLTSFTGELGNMIAGNLATNLSRFEITTDITSPVLLEDESNQLATTDHAVSMDLLIESKDTTIQVILFMNTKN